MLPTIEVDSFSDAGVFVAGAASSLPKWETCVGLVCLVWYLIVLLVCTVGYLQLRRFYSSLLPPAISTTLTLDKVPHVTIIRPVKGLEPNLYECLAASFRQRYPRQRVSVYLCIPSRLDPALCVLERLLHDFPHHNAKIFVEDEAIRSTSTPPRSLGPNPKISNMSRAYREAKGDIIWIVDCNVWVSAGVLGRMIDKLCGFDPALSPGHHGKRYKFVHQLPLVVDIATRSSGEESFGLLHGSSHAADDGQVTSTSADRHHGRSFTQSQGQSAASTILSSAGGRLEELFFASSHAKFYTAINTVLIAPCIVGKSNMFRRSHLDALTAPASASASTSTGGNDTNSHGSGLDFFSENICEDHLIGDLLWKGRVPGEGVDGETWGKHALLFGDLVIQPMAGMSVKDYISRRVRWLRVRKFTVTLATLVEPGTESLLCSLYGAYAITTLRFFTHTLHIPSSWTAFVAFWLLSVAVWAYVDWTVYLLLHSAATVEVDEHTPAFARPPSSSSSATRPRRSFQAWFAAWLGRELLAFPIWAWSFWGGTTITWRGKRFWVGMDMKVHEISDDAGQRSQNAAGILNSSKARTD